MSNNAHRPFMIFSYTHIHVFLSLYMSTWKFLEKISRHCWSIDMGKWGNYLKFCTLNYSLVGLMPKYSRYYPNYVRFGMDYLFERLNLLRLEVMCHFLKRFIKFLDVYICHILGPVWRLPGYQAAYIESAWERTNYAAAVTDSVRRQAIVTLQIGVNYFSFIPVNSILT